MRTNFFNLLTLTGLLWLAVSASAQNYPEFDRGPELSDPMQEELLEIVQDMPYLPGISEQLQVLAPEYKKGQKMRPDFGAMPLRGFLVPNTISVLVIGQDGTHIAEGANRPGIAGFGGRVHDMLRHFGVLEGVFFTNLYVNTISGQYGSRSTPVIVSGKTLQYTNVIENRQWLMTHEGAYGKWRNRFLSWVIRNNTKSLKMVMLLGQAGKDAGSNLVNFLGGTVTARSYVGDGSQYNVPWFEMVGAGGNNEWAVPVTAEGEDIAELLRQDDKIREALKVKLQDQLATEADAKKKNALNKRIKALDKPLDYRDGGMDGTGISTENAKDLLTDNLKQATQMMVFTHGGPQKNGVLKPEQFGGWDLDTMTVNGKKTRSIKGLKVPCEYADGKKSHAGLCANGSYVTAPDIVFVGAPHPTSLSMGEMTKPGSASVKVEKELIAPLKAEMKRGWTPPQPEKGMTSAFLAGKPYHYGRGLIPQSHGDPGITDLRLLPVSTAKRQGSSMIVIGTRGSAKFDSTKIKAMEKDTPSEKWLLQSHDVLTGRPKFDEWSDKYDRGPNDTYSKLLFHSLTKKTNLWVKSAYDKEAQALFDKSMSKKKADDTMVEAQEDAYNYAVNAIHKKYAMDAFNFKTHPDAGFFGHYRGTFENPKVIMLVDPDGYDSFITSKAATGNRGQYLNGIMDDLGVGADYLVINTVPFGMDTATKDDWDAVLTNTKKYRDNLFAQLMKDYPTAIYVADGANAATELKRILGSDDFVAIKRSQTDASYGIKAGGEAIKAKLKSRGSISADRKDIPREHLTWIARVWEGTSGERVITADPSDKANFGSAFAIVAPDWARKNKVHFSDSTRSELANVMKALVAAGEPQPWEKLTDYIKRRANCVSLSEWKQNKAQKKCELAKPITFPNGERIAN